MIISIEYKLYYHLLLSLLVFTDTIKVKKRSPVVSPSRARRDGFGFLAPLVDCLGAGGRGAPPPWFHCPMLPRGGLGRGGGDAPLHRPQLGVYIRSNLRCAFP